MSEDDLEAYQAAYDAYQRAYEADATHGACIHAAVDAARAPLLAEVERLKANQPDSGEVRACAATSGNIAKTCPNCQDQARRIVAILRAHPRDLPDDLADGIERGEFDDPLSAPRTC